jgi:DNA-binding NarL/FixJ family response regulator
MISRQNPMPMARPRDSKSKPAKRIHHVVIVDDHPMIREHLTQLLSRQPGVVVAGQAANAKEGLVLIEQTEPDLAVIDMKLPGSCGLELVKDVRSRNLKTRVLVLSMHDEELYAERAFKAGANGYITKENVSAEIVHAIQIVMGGETYASDAVKAKLVDRVEQLAASELSSLTDRELEVFLLIGRGKDTRTIAAELELGVSTVETYRCRIKRKLNIRNAADLYLRAGLWVRDHGG